MLDKIWKEDEEKIEGSSVFWNIVSGGLISAISMILLWMVTRANGVNDAGVFSLGFSTAQMLVTIGNYGMRNYQATDIEGKYEKHTYLVSRWCTCMLMMAIAVGFVVIKQYYLEKALVVVLLCLLKATDAIDDVYGGEYQRRGRLDIAGKMMSFRILGYLIIFSIVIFITHDLVITCMATIVTSSILLLIFVKSIRGMLKCEPYGNSDGGTLKLLIECLPLCVSSFLLIYFGNAPKYAIDSYMGDEMQAYYTYLFMPCFVINLFVSFAIQPLLTKLSLYWMQKRKRKFLKLVLSVFACTLGIALVVILGGEIIGIELLSLVFGVGLREYKTVLMILLIGGAFYAFCVIGQVILTIMRKQTLLMICFGVASIIAYCASGPLVKHYGLFGASYSYLLSTISLFLILVVSISFNLKRNS